MAINFDGKGNIESTTEDGVIAIKLYSLEKQIEEKDKEIERLNNIIEKLEKWLKDVDVFQMNFIENKEHITPYKAVLDKLKELKEGKQ